MTNRLCLDDLIGLIARRNKTKNSTKRRCLSPHVGIFWVIKDELYLDTTPIEDAELYGGDFKVHPVGHYEYWEEHLSSHHSALPEDIKARDYDYYPRGRVVYSVNQDCFYLYRDNCVSEEMVRLIISLMGLSESNVSVLSDTHYQCTACSKHYVA